MTAATDMTPTEGDTPSTTVSHDIGNIVAAIAAFDPSNPSPGLADPTTVADPQLHSSELSSGHPVAADDAHATAPVDLSDVGALLSHSVNDLAASHLDLDHLTSNLNLFDTGHVEGGMDVHHS